VVEDTLPSRGEPVKNRPVTNSEQTVFFRDFLPLSQHLTRFSLTAPASAEPPRFIRHAVILRKRSPARRARDYRRRTYVFPLPLLFRLHHDQPLKTLYTGVTSHLEQRVFEHKQGVKGEFAARYKIDRLVYFESFDSIHSAIAREKQIKGLLRIKKIALIVSMNPEWGDLSAEWLVRHQYQPENPISTQPKLSS
jgi:putative endonuclease